MTGSSFQNRVDDVLKSEKERTDARLDQDRIQLEGIAAAQAAETRENERVWGQLVELPQYADLKRSAESQELRDALVYLYSLAHPTVRYPEKFLFWTLGEVTIPLGFELKIIPFSYPKQTMLKISRTCGFQVLGSSEKPAPSIQKKDWFHELPFSFSIEMWVDETGSVSYGLISHVWARHDADSDTISLLVFQTMDQLLSHLAQWCPLPSHARAHFGFHCEFKDLTYLTTVPYL